MSASRRWICIVCCSSQGSYHAGSWKHGFRISSCDSWTMDHSLPTSSRNRISIRGSNCAHIGSRVWCWNKLDLVVCPCWSKCNCCSIKPIEAWKLQVAWCILWDKLQVSTKLLRKSLADHPSRRSRFDLGSNNGRVFLPEQYAKLGMECKMDHLRFHGREYSQNGRHVETAHEKCNNHNFNPEKQIRWVQNTIDQKCRAWLPTGFRHWWAPPSHR